MISITMAYNGLETRVSKTDSGGTKTFKRAGVGVTAAVLSDGAASYTPGISEKRGGASTFYSGGIKNTDTQTNATQAVSASRLYDAFGNVISSTGVWNSPFGNAGKFGYQEDQDTGLKLLGHRYYDSSTGRFLTRDPVKDGRNWYSYCNNNPIIRVDPSGFWELYKLLVTGDADASDLEYEGGLLGLDDAINRWFGHFGDEQEWALPVATLGMVAVGGRRKPSKFRQLGARPSSSFARELGIKYRGTNHGRAARGFARGIKDATTSGFDGKTYTTCLKAPVAWFLIVEAVAAVRAGYATYLEPNGADIGTLVDEVAWGRRGKDSVGIQLGD